MLDARIASNNQPLSESEIMWKKTSDNKLSIDLTEVLPTPAQALVVIHGNSHPFPTAIQSGILQHRRFLVILDVVYILFSGRLLIRITVAARVVDTCGCSLARCLTAYASLIPHCKASALMTTPHILLLIRQRSHLELLKDLHHGERQKVLLPR